MSGEKKFLWSGLGEKLGNVHLPDLKSLGRITRISSLGKGRRVLIVAAIIWSSLMASNLSVQASAPQLMQTAGVGIMLSGAMGMRSSRNLSNISGIPYKNSHGEIVVSGSAAKADYELSGCQPQAQLLYDIARANEPAITMDMLQLSDELGTTMEGLQYSVKTASSVKSKINRRASKAIEAGQLPKSDSEYVNESKDLIRYTQVVPHEDMAAKTREIVQMLESKGYIVNKLYNKYLDDNGRYKAIHLDVASSTGQQFEIQIHSPETMEANRLTHGMYEEWRKPDTEPARKQQLFSEIKAVYDAMEEPAGIREIKSFTRDRYVN